MSKKQFIEQVYEFCLSKNVSVSKKFAGELTDHVFASVEKEVATSGKFSYPKFGTFSAKTREARTYRNPQTGNPIHKPASNYVGFKQSTAWKQNMN